MTDKPYKTRQDKGYRTTDLTPEDQERLQRIIDFPVYAGAVKDFPKAIRVAMSAWETANLPQPVSAGPSMAADPEGNKEFLDREMEQQLNPKD